MLEGFIALRCFVALLVQKMRVCGISLVQASIKPGLQWILVVKNKFLGLLGGSEVQLKSHKIYR